MTDLIIDTDVALGVWHEGRPRDIDDGFALVEAINNPQINLLGITCVFGNGPLDDVVRVARDIVELKASQTPVIAGASQNIEAVGVTNEAVEFLAGQLRKQRLSIAAIGPLTNIGLLIAHHPDVIENIDELIIVAGRSKDAHFYIGDAGPVMDFNFENDVAAAERVMDANIPTVLMGFELTSQVCVTSADLETIRTHQSPTASYFYENSQAWCEYWTDTFPVDAGFHPWDSATIAWLVAPELFKTERRAHLISREPKRLECDAGFPGPTHTYCTGFQPGGKERFVSTVIEQVY